MPWRQPRQRKTNLPRLRAPKIRPARVDPTRPPGCHRNSDMKKIAVVAFVAAVLGAVPFARAEVAPGQPAPDFTLTDTNGKPHQLSSLKGKYVVLEWTN